MTWKRLIEMIHSEDKPRVTAGQEQKLHRYVTETPERGEEIVRKNRCGEMVAGNFCEKYEVYRFEASRTQAE